MRTLIETWFQTTHPECRLLFEPPYNLSVWVQELYVEYKQTKYQVFIKDGLGYILETHD